MSNTTLGQSPDAVQDNLQNAQGNSAGQQYSNGEQLPISAPAAAQRPTALETMRNCQRWLLWREEPNPNTEGKPLKVPYYASGTRRSGTLDTDGDWQQLVSFAEACRAFSHGGFTGLAFALGPDRNGGCWQGIDLDNIERNHLSDLANNAPGYVEFSPSRLGIHAIGYGRGFNALGSNGTGVEAYSAGRFFTFTGEVIRDSGLTCLADYVVQRAAPAHGTGRSPTSSPAASVHVEPRVITELRSALNHLSSDDYHMWVRIGLALYCLGDTGRGLWMDWSATSSKFNPSEAAKKWQSLKSDNSSYQTVFHVAQQHGWVNPKSNGAQIQIAVPTSNISVDVEEARIVKAEYLDDPYIPKGEPIGIYGRGGAAKSSFVSTLTAKNSNRYSTLWITSEESPDHIKLRHKYSGGVDKTIGVISSSEFNIYTHLEGAIKEAKSKLARPLGFVVLDAVVALVTWGKGESPNDDAAVKRLINHIGRLAQVEGVSILMIGHLNKGKGHEHIADAVLGAAAWTSSPRISYMLQKMPDLDHAGFIRTAKTNQGIPFGAFYSTVPVFQMEANIDGVRPSLCKVDFTSERIYGERALAIAMGDEGKAEVLNKKQQLIDQVIDRALYTLQDGTQKTREDIQANCGMLQVSRRMWVSVDEQIVTQNVVIMNGERNRKFYQLCAAVPPP